MKEIRTGPTLSLIIPALNEEALVEGVVRDVLAKVEGRFADFEIILIDDGSTDRTADIMEGLAAGHTKIRFLRNMTNLGLGAAYRRGVAAARFDYVMMLCGDGGLPAASLTAVFERIGSEDIVVPYMTNLREIKSPARYVMSRAYTGVLNRLFGLRLHYYNGLPVHRLHLLQGIEITSSGFAFQGEILVKLIKSGCSYIEIGVAGATGRERSSAARMRNVIGVAKTLAFLVWSMRGFVGHRGVPAPTALRQQSASD